MPVIFAAGVLAVIPDLALTLSGTLGDSGMQTLNDEWGNHLVWGGKMTWLGFLRFFVIRPIVYWLMGAVGGLVFWMIATNTNPFVRKSSPTA